MEFQQLIQRAKAVRKKYAALEKKRYSAEWTTEELALGFAGDVGDLAKLVVAVNGKRDIPNANERFAHELADCLWSVIVLAEAHSVDLEQAFLNTMDELDKLIDESMV